MRLDVYVDVSHSKGPEIGQKKGPCQPNEVQQAQVKDVVLGSGATPDIRTD